MGSWLGNRLTAKEQSCSHMIGRRSDSRERKEAHPSGFVGHLPRLKSDHRPILFHFSCRAQETREKPALQSSRKSG